VSELTRGVLLNFGLSLCSAGVGESWLIFCVFMLMCEESGNAYFGDLDDVSRGQRIPIFETSNFKTLV
jgi:hypothetical protein